MNLVDFHFIRPYWLFALIPMALFIALSVRNKLAQGNWKEVCDSALLPFILQETTTQSSRRWLSITMSIASLLAIIALAGPTWERLPTPAFRNDAALVIALDLSRSMDATDIKPNRLIRARYKIADILQQRKDGLTALIVYAGDAFTVTPLTDDTATISNQLNALTTDIMPSQGSNTLAAIQLAVKLIQQAGQPQGSILLITDGINPNLLDSVNKVLGNYQLSILGVGTPEGAPVKLANGGFLKDRQGNIVVPKLNIAQLTSLAHTGNGIYQTIRSDDRDIQTLLAYSDRTKQKSSEHSQNHIVEQWAEQGPWLLLIILPLAALYFRKGLLVIPLILLLNFPQNSYAFSWQDLWQTHDQQAQQAFDQQQFDKAAQQFQSPEWKATAEYKAGHYSDSVKTLKSINTADSLYNQGNALAKAGKLQQAITAYQHALNIDSNLQDAAYNKKIVEQALKKQQKQQSDKDQSKDQNKDQGKSKDQNKDQKQGKDQKQKNNNNQDGKQSKHSDNKQNDDNSSDQQQQVKQPQQTAKDSKKQDQANKQADKSEQQKTQPSPTDQASQKKKSPEKNKANKAETTQMPSAQQNDNDENEQANAQWLKRIPDDPAGLLKRKFKYQYNQRNQRSQQEQSW